MKNKQICLENLNLSLSCARKIRVKCFDARDFNEEAIYRLKIESKKLNCDFIFFI